MRNIILIMFAIYALSSMSAKAQDYVKGDCYEGYIFNANNKHYSTDKSLKRFKPSKADIISVEKALKKNIKQINKLRPNQGKGCPNIHRKLHKYNRQYIGYINDKGLKVIWMNFIWKEDCPDYWKEEIVDILDGCSYYWSIKVELKSMEFSEFRVNGRS